MKKLSCLILAPALVVTVYELGPAARRLKTIQVRGERKVGKVDGDDFDVAQGRREQLIGRIQERYGIAKEEAQKQADEFVKQLRELLAEHKKAHGATQRWGSTPAPRAFSERHTNELNSSLAVVLPLSRASYASPDPNATNLLSAHRKGERSFLAPLSGGFPEQDVFETLALETTASTAGKPLATQR